MIRKAALKFTLILSAVMMFFSFSSCAKDEIADFYNKIDKADSAEVQMKMTVPMVGSVIVTIKYDGNIYHQTSFMTEPEKYMEIIGNKIYTYTRLGDHWIKDNGQSYDTEEIMTESEGFIELFVSDNYKYDKKEKAYILKEDLGLTLAEMDILSMSLKISSDGCNLDGELCTAGVIVPMQLKIKNINNTEVTLPETLSVS